MRLLISEIKEHPVVSAVLKFLQKTCNPPPPILLNGYEWTTNTSGQESDSQPDCFVKPTRHSLNKQQLLTMKTKFHSLLIALALSASLHQAAAQGTAFTYEGRLNVGTNPVTGSFDMTFALFDAPTFGTQEGSTITNLATGVTNGLFTLPLDFGNQFPGANRWLEISVRTNGVLNYTNLSPREALLPTPYAIYAEAAGISSSVSNLAVTASSLNTIAAPASGQILSYNGSSLSWITPTPNGSLTLPYSGNASSSSSLFTLQNTGSGPAGAFLGNVGIGVTAPMAKLQIYGNSAPGSHIPSNEAVLSSGDGFHNGYMSATGDAAVTLDMWNGTYGEVSTYNYATAQGLPLVFNSNGGNVGIGTTTPAARLDVVTSSNNAVAVRGFNSMYGIFAGAAYGELAVSSVVTNPAIEGGGYTVSTNLYGVYGNGGIRGGYAGYFDGDVTVNGDVSMGNATLFGDLNAESAQFNGDVGVFGSISGTIGGFDEVSIGSKQLTSDTNILDVESFNDSGYFLSPTALIRNNDTGSAAAPALTVAGMGTTGYGVLCVTTGGTGLLARFGNANNWVADIRNNGEIDALEFNPTSDRNAKENFSAVSAKEVLQKVVSLPITKWNFKQAVGTSHIGPMAQDFRAAFNVGSDDRHIATVDEDGVALAAIQGLNQKLDEKDTEIQDLKKTVDQLKAMMQSLAEKK
jgi:hypothetical protein